MTHGITRRALHEGVIIRSGKIQLIQQFTFPTDSVLGLLPMPTGNRSMILILY